MDKLHRVVIVGGTHGNEMTGIYLARKFAQHHDLIQRSGFSTQVLLGNPKAIAARVRYIDQDLNRSFEYERLQNSQLASYEDLRAKQIDQMIGPSSNTPVDVIVDLHSTTANMGLTLMIDQEDRFSLQLADHIQRIHTDVNVYSTVNSGRSRDSLRSLAKFGFCVEVGPVAQGVLNAELFVKTETLVCTILDYLEQYNHNKISSLHGSFILHRYLGTIDYPKDGAGELQAMIHPQLQGKDYEPLRPGNPMFLKFSGETIPYSGDSTIYPVFINEAAYCEKGIAMCLMQKAQVSY
ncbi:MAG TPA: aspartoacylase [Chroococcidiopsis sp.]